MDKHIDITKSLQENILDDLHNYYMEQGEFPSVIIVNHYTRNELRREAKSDYPHLPTGIKRKKITDADFKEELDGIEIVVRMADHRSEKFYEFK